MEWMALSSGLLANAGLPLVERGMWALAVTTVLVAAFEAALLKRWFEVRPVVVLWTGKASPAAGMDDQPERWTPLASLLVLLANVVSTVAGAFYFSHSRQALSWIMGNRPLERASVYIFAVCVSAFLISVLVEWPFFSKAIKDRPLSREGLLVCLGCNLLTGAAVVVWFALSGMTSLLTPSNIKQPWMIAKPGNAEVFYRDSLSGDLWTVGVNGYGPHSLGIALPSGDSVSVDMASNGDTKVYAVRSDGSFDRPLLDLGTSRRASVADGADSRWLKRTGYFGAQEARKYRVEIGRDAYDGLSVWTPDHLYKLALDSTPLSWNWSHVTVLPNNQAIAEVGPQIVLIDLDSGAIAEIAVGDSPAVAWAG